MPATSRRTAVFTESLIREMTRVAARHNAINLSQGFPDGDPPPALLAAAHAAMDAGRHQYAMTWGSPELRTALAAKLHRFTGAHIDPDTELVVTCGATEAMMVAMMTVCDPGDRVGLFSPFYENYGADAILTGATPVHVRLHAPDFRFDPAELRAAFASGLKAFILCNPSNPCGRVFSREELLQIAALAAEYAGQRDILLSYLDRAGLTYTRPEGAYFVMVAISRFGYASDVEFAHWLAREIGVAGVPGSSFFTYPENRYIRLNFAKKPATLHAAGERLLRLANFLVTPLHARVTPDARLREAVHRLVAFIECVLHARLHGQAWPHAPRRKYPRY